MRFRTQPLDESPDRSVDAVKEAVLVAVLVQRIRKNGVHQFVACVTRARRDVELTRALRGLMAQALNGELLVTRAEQSRILRGLNLYGVVRTLAEPCTDVELLRLPGEQPSFDLLWKLIRIGGSAERCFGKNAGGLVMPVSVIGIALKARDDDVRPEGSDDPHHIRQRNLVTPLLKGLVRGLAEPEVADASEPLVNIVVAVGVREFQRAKHAKFVEQPAARTVLASLAAIQREQLHMHAISARKQRQKASVFVIRVSGGVQQASCVLQMADSLHKSGGAGVLRKRREAFLCGLGTRNCGERENQKNSSCEATRWSHSSLRVGDMNCALHRMQ